MTARLAHRAEDSPPGILAATLVCALILVILPIWYYVARQPPSELTARFYSFDISEASFTVSNDSVVFRGGDTILAAPLEFFPQDDIERGNWAEIFDRLALLNSYFRDFLLPIILLLSLLCMFTILSLSGMIAGLMNMGRKLTHSLTYSKRLRVFCACAWLPAMPSMLLGFIMPIFHLLIYQVLLGLLAWRVQKLL